MLVPEAFVTRSVADVAIVGAGLVGSSLGAALARRGLRVVICDPHHIYPPDFRAEKLSSDQVAALRRLELAEPVLATATLIDHLWIARFGKIVEHRPNCEYGIDYAPLVNALRAQIPPDCFALGRVAHIDASAALQTITFNDGRQISSRITVIATGLGNALLKNLGIDRALIEADFSLSIGFDIAPAGRPIAFSSFTYYGERIEDRCAYLTIFPIMDRLRANLFVYRRYDDDWSRSFRAEPRESLLATLPNFGVLMPEFAIAGTPILRPIHLYRAEAYLRDGIVLAGDAFSTTCPAGGGGVSKALNDVECLVKLIPIWLASAGFGSEKVAQFYRDPNKRAVDHAVRSAQVYARAMTLNPGPLWSARRRRNYFLQKLRYLARQRICS
jgi:2-polyprenyl-6-methoxyphenol hydroxylase-like FAD-dependent oxidoreductase